MHAETLQKQNAIQEQIAEKKRAAEEAQRKVKQAQEASEIIRRQDAEARAKRLYAEQQLKEQRAARLAQAAALREAEKQRRLERQKLVALQKEEERKQKEEKRRQEKELRAQEEAAKRKVKELSRAKKAEAARRAKEEREYRAALKKEHRKARKAAEMGGGIVNVHDVQIATEIQPVPDFKYRDVLKHILTKPEEDIVKRIGEENSEMDAALETAERLRQVRLARINDTLPVKVMKKFRDFCDRHHRPLLVIASVILVIGVGTAGAFNFFSLYEYSYNGTPLGYVKNKDDVLQITELVQNALAADKEENVVIDAKEDITFDRVSTFGKEITADDQDEILKRLTYMGDVDVEACAVFIDGTKVGSVQKEKVAAAVLKDIEEMYASGKSGSEIEEAVVVENVEFKTTNTRLGNILSEDEMVEKLTTPVEKEQMHTAVAGETLESVATDHGIELKQLKKENPGVPNKLAVGTAVVIRQTAPPLTVKITEKRTYEHTIKYETEKKKTKKLYKGDSQVKIDGKNGKSKRTERNVYVNGEKVDSELLDEQISKKPVTKVVMVGSAKRPPTIGDGQYDWPMKGGYVITSYFGARWGRMHEGIDMGCASGSYCYASDGGTVINACYLPSYGNVVIIDHQNGDLTYYAHLSGFAVSNGDKVYAGQLIAYTGNTGNSTGPHLHFGIKRNGSFINPMSELP